MPFGQFSGLEARPQAPTRRPHRGNRYARPAPGIRYKSPHRGISITALARIIDAVPQRWLVGIQFYRALGVIFLILYGTGKLPGLFAWPASLGDVLVGVLAPVVAVAYARDPHQNGDLVSTWNLFGLADLVIAVSAGFLTSPSPFQLFAFEAPNELITTFPLVLVPVFLVPVSVLLHLASLTKLHRDALRDNPREKDGGDRWFSENRCGHIDARAGLSNMNITLSGAGA